MVPGTGERGDSQLKIPQNIEDKVTSARKKMESRERLYNNVALVRYVCVALHWNDYVGLSFVNSNTQDFECKRADDDVETWPRTETKSRPKTQMLRII